MKTFRPDLRWLAEVLRGGAAIPLGQADLVELAKVLRRVELTAGTVLYGEGRPPRGTWIVERGCVELSEGSGAGRSVVGVIRDGAIVGDIPLLLNIPPPFTARCSEDLLGWFLPGDEFRRLLGTFPSLAIAWLCNVSGRLQQTRSRVLVVLGRSLPQRLAGILLEEAVDGVVRLPQRTLAQMLGVQRTSVNKTLKDFEEGGLVILGYGLVRLADPARLEAIAAGAPAGGEAAGAEVRDAAGASNVVACVPNDEPEDLLEEAAVRRTG